MDMTEEPSAGGEEEEEAALQEDLRALRGMMEESPPESRASAILQQLQGRGITDDPGWARRVRALCLYVFVGGPWCLSAFPND